MSSRKSQNQQLSRRALLKSMGLAPLLLRPAPFFGSPFSFPAAATFPDRNSSLPLSDFRLKPRYPSQSPLADVLRLIEPGSDEFATEKYAFEVESILREWGNALKSSPRELSLLKASLDPAVEASPLLPSEEIKLRSGGGIDVVRRRFPSATVAGSDRFFQSLQGWLAPLERVETAEFQITGIEEVTSGPQIFRLDIRYDLVAVRHDSRREERVGSWRTEWLRNQPGSWQARRWEAGEETVSITNAPAFLDITAQALGGAASYRSQLLRGADHWRTTLDGACGIDVYGNNGVAVGDFDNDGFDDIYVCQPSGLPNRLYRNRGDGTFDDVTEKAGVGVLDGTACALFADFRNNGLQDLLVVCGGGPLLFLNRGDGTFAIKRDAFKFKTPPEGTFTHAALADYDRDGRIDVYFCLYSYYVGLDQYHYPVPYFDARNGPPNFLMHNDGDGAFTDRTETAGLNAENDRYSFACAWGDYEANGLADLSVANDFGRSNLYRNNGNGTFTAVSAEAHAADAGAGMSTSWSDFNNDGRQDIYVANMWSAAGQRVAAQKNFHPDAPEETRALYRRHARGNALYRNQGNGKFENVASQGGAEMGRWSWCSDFWDFDHDGYPDIYIANGYVSAPELSDLASFFWRQVVGKSPDDATPALAYERGWQALNESIRSDISWSGYERNVMLANNRDGTFAEVSGAVGLDFIEDGRSFALADLDHDGRLEVILKNRNAPQLRIMRNVMKDLGRSISFRLRGTKSNRDAIGSAITLDAGPLRQTKYLQAGSGFLAQHSKELFFGVGAEEGPFRATVRWPDGSSQQFDQLPVDSRIEIEEGSAAFAAKPFRKPPAIDSEAGAIAKLEPLPSHLDTWLLEPLKAPEFSLPDLTGNPRSLSSFRGGVVLLNFWALAAPLCRDQLQVLQRSRSAPASAKIPILAVNLDDADNAVQARAFAMREGFSFPILFATEEVAGVYNIIYRYLFDRRRDLPIPASFLLNSEGMIVKIYQGPLDLERLMQDAHSIPNTTADRMRRALPFEGALYQDAFQRNDFTYGIAMFQHGYLEEAAASFQQVIAEKPNDAEGYYNLGTLKLRQNDFQQARRYLEKTLELRPNYPEAWNNLGMMAARQGQPDEAIQSFQRSLALRPRYAIALLNLGNVYRRQGSFDKARQCLASALEIQPDDPEANYSLGMLYAQQNQAQSASEYLRKAIELRPAYPEALNNLGVLFVREQDYAKAEQQFKTCVRLVPAFDQSYLNLARLYTLQGDKEKARGALRDLLRLQPENASALQALEVLK